MAGRPRGYAKWDPKQQTRLVLQQVQQVLDEYQAFLPLTARQIFYRLVGSFGYEKTERGYARLCEYLVRARRAQMISFGDIRDDGTVHNSFLRYSSPADFWKRVASNAEHYVRDRLENQPVHVELWCEAAGMVPQLERAASPYSVPVFSTGGFSSVTVTYEIADRALLRDKPTVFLHVGDFDPSGESIFDAMTRDAAAFLHNRLVWKLREAGDAELVERYWPERRLHPLGDLPAHLPDLRPTRVALTAEQVEEYDLPTAPPKATDSRSVNWTGETCQLEAMPPDMLADLIDGAISDVLDLDLLEDVRDEERREARLVEAKVAELLAGGDDE